MPHRLQGLAGLGRLALVLRVPDDHARMVPPLAHPLGVLGDDLLGLRVLRRLAQQPDGELVLDQEAHLVGDVVPQLRRKADAVADRVPVHALELLVEPPDPLRPPGLVAPLGVLEEAVGTDVGAAHEVRLAVEDRPCRSPGRTGTTACRSASRPCRRRCSTELVEERVLRRPEPAGFAAERRGPASSRYPPSTGHIRLRHLADDRAADRLRDLARHGTGGLDRRICNLGDDAHLACRRCPARSGYSQMYGSPERINSTES